jgi:hypothetical protein
MAIDFVAGTVTVSLHLEAKVSDAQVANRDFRDFGWEVAHAAVTRRPPNSLDTMVVRIRTEGCVRRRGLGFVHRSRAMLCRAVPNPNVTIRTSCIV